MNNAKLTSILRESGVEVYASEAFEQPLPYIVYDEIRRRARCADDLGILPIRTLSVKYYTSHVDDGMTEQLSSILGKSRIPHSISFRLDVERGYTVCDFMCEVKGNA